MSFISGSQTDFGERIPHLNIKYHDGADPMRMHNAYAVLYNEIVFNLLEERFGKGEAVVFARAAAAGGQRFPVVRVILLHPFRNFVLILIWGIALGR